MTFIAFSTVITAQAFVKEKFCTPTDVLGFGMAQRKRRKAVRKSKAAQQLARLKHAKQTPEQRSEEARKRAAARWSKKPPPPPSS